MSEIDPETLERAIRFLGASEGYEDCPLKVVIAAAEKLLPSLPRYKEVEVESWATFFHDGRICSSGLTEKEARGAAARSPLEQVAVRLTGTAKVKVAP